MSSRLFPSSLSHVTWHGWTLDTYHGAVNSFGEILRDEVESEMAALATVPSSAHNMLPCMERDADSTFAVLAFLEVKDICKLATTCTAWKRWIHAPHAHTKRALLTQAHAFPAVVASWIRPYIDELKLGALPAPAPTAIQRLGFLFARPFIGLGLLAVMARPFAQLALHHIDQRWHPMHETLTSDRTEDVTRAFAHQSLELMTQLPAMRTLILQLACLYLERPKLDACFSSLAPRLETLSVMLMQDNVHGFMLLLELLGAVSQLKLLRRLNFTARMPFEPRALPFEALRTLPRLETLELDVSEALWVCSARQLDCLCACPALTALSCGSFGPTVDDEGQPIYEQQSDEDEQAMVHGLERLIASKRAFAAASAAASRFSAAASARAASAVSASSSSTSSSSSPSAVVAAVAAAVAGAVQSAQPWRHFDLTRTRQLTPTLWAALQVSAASIEVLEPASWSLTLSAEDWAALSDFKQLRRLTLADDLDPARFMPGLLSVSATLHRLELVQIALRDGDLGAILRAAPLLAELLLSLMPVEFSALTHAGPAMQSLTLGRITDEHRQRCVQVRPLLPSMPHLTCLLICDDNETRLTGAQAEPLNEALFARCPKLKPEMCMQNLWD